MGHQTLKAIYRLNQFAIVRNHSRVFITLNFPLMLTDTDLTLYRLLALNMPVDAQNLHSSQVEGLPKYLAYSPKSNWYLEFEDLPQLDNNLYHLHLNPTALRYKTSPTCAIAFLEMSRTDVPRFCKFAIHPFNVESQVHIVGPGKLLLRFIDSYTLECANQPPQSFPGCPVCIVQLKCQCSFQSGRHRYHARIAHCQNETDVYQPVSYALNLHYLQKYFNTTTLIPDHQQLLDYIPHLLLPNVSIHQSELATQSGILKSTTLDMDKVVKNTVNSSDIFTDISEILQTQIQQTQLDIMPKFSIRTIETILIFVNPVISILALVGLLHIYCKFRTITAALMLTSAHRVSSLHIDRNKIWIPDYSRTAKPMLNIPTLPPFTLTIPPMKQIEFEDISFQAAIITLIIIIILLMFLRRILPLFRFCCKICTRVRKQISQEVVFDILLSVDNTT